MNKNDIIKKYCIATVTTKNYISGTVAMLSSFLKNNKWFNADIIIITDLNYDLLRPFSKFKNIKFITPQDKLIKKINLLKQKIPYLESIYPRFFKFEIFALKEYKRVIFIDSDVLCKKSIYRLFQTENDFVACRDPIFYKNKVRSLPSYLPVNKDQNKKLTTLEPSFNSGVMSISKKYLNQCIYDNLLKLMDIEAFLKLEDIIADEFILNILFSDKLKIFPATFNYIIHLKKEILLKDNIKPHEAYLIHYTGLNKPWTVIGNIKLLFRGLHYLIFILYWQYERLFKYKYYKNVNI